MGGGSWMARVSRVQGTPVRFSSGGRVLDNERSFDLAQDDGRSSSRPEWRDLSLVEARASTRTFRATSGPSTSSGRREIVVPSEVEGPLVGRAPDSIERPAGQVTGCQLSTVIHPPAPSFPILGGSVLFPYGRLQQHLQPAQGEQIDQQVADQHDAADGGQRAAQGAIRCQ